MQGPKHSRTRLPSHFHTRIWQPLFQHGPNQSVIVAFLLAALRFHCCQVQGIATDDDGAEGNSKQLSIVRWVAGFQCYALSAAACEIWSLPAAWAHFRVCMEIAATAALSKRRATLAVTYDRLARQTWCNKAARGRHCAVWHAMCMVVRLCVRRPWL